MSVDVATCADSAALLALLRIVACSPCLRHLAVRLHGIVLDISQLGGVIHPVCPLVSLELHLSGNADLGLSIGPLVRTAGPPPTLASASKLPTTAPSALRNLSLSLPVGMTATGLNRSLVGILYQHHRLQPGVGAVRAQTPSARLQIHASGSVRAHFIFTERRGANLGQRNVLRPVDGRVDVARRGQLIGVVARMHCLVHVDLDLSRCGLCDCGSWSRLRRLTALHTLQLDLSENPLLGHNTSVCNHRAGGRFETLLGTGNALASRPARGRTRACRCGCFPVDACRSETAF